MFMPAFALINNYLMLAFCVVTEFALRGIDGAYPDPGVNVEAIELFGSYGASIRMCYS